MRLLAAALLLCFSLSAQEANSRVVGTVTDPTAAVVVGAKVVVTETATGTSRNTVSDKDGNFQILNLPIGAYRVDVESSGFRKSVTNERQLFLNETLRFDVKLEVGSAAETVQVETKTSTVETVTATVGSSVTGETIRAMPLNGRNALSLALLAPGVTPSSSRSVATPAGTGFSIAGGRADSVTFLLDGGINNNLLNNGVVLNPNPDMVAEFKVLASNYTAEYGRNSGGVVSVVTRSGNNALHFSAFDFLRNEKLNSNPFFNNRDGQSRPILKRNQYGGTIGGPIVLPKLLNGKDKLFFFVGYQGQRQTSVVPFPASSTFTPAELNGDFSRSNVAQNGPDLGVVPFLQANPFFQPNATAAAQGIIDPSRINSVAKNYIGAGLIPTSPTGRLLPQGAAANNAEEITGRFDWVPTQNDRISATLGFNHNPVVIPNSFATVSGYSVNTEANKYLGNVNYTKIFTPMLINEARLVAQRNNNFQAAPAFSKPTGKALGFGIVSDDPTGPPMLGFASGLVTGFSPQGPTALIDNTYMFSDNLTWIRGRHTMKGGFLFVPYQNNSKYDFYVNGEFFFYGAIAAGGIGSSNDRADFLLGLPSEYFQAPQAPSNIRSKAYNGFFQDEWKVARNLTLTFGLRYEYSGPKRDLQGRSFSVFPGAQSTVFSGAPKGILFPGDALAPTGANFPDKNDWAPRFGFAWAPGKNAKMSIRGGVGVFYDILKGEDNLQFNGQIPFFAAADLFFDPLAANPTRETNYYSSPFAAVGQVNPFPSGAINYKANFDDSGFLPLGGGGVYVVDPELRTPYVFQYNLSIQRQLPANMMAEGSYVGYSAHKLTSLMDVNPFVRGTSTRTLNTAPGNPPYAFSYFDQFTNVSNAHFNSLQLSLQQRTPTRSFMGETFYTLAYTLSHEIDNVAGFRETNSRVPFYNHNQFTASGDNDQRHRIVMSGSWDFKLDRWGGPKRLLSGWTMSSIVTYGSGFTLDVLAGLSRSRTSTGPSGAGDPNLVRADLVAGGVTSFDPRLSQSFRGRTANYYFDPATFSNARFTTALNAAVVASPSLATYGNLGRNAFRGPGLVNADVSLSKRTMITERLSSEFRVEFFNVFNHANFGNPTTAINSSLFGQISTTNINSPSRIGQLALRFAF